MSVFGAGHLPCASSDVKIVGGIEEDRRMQKVLLERPRALMAGVSDLSHREVVAI